MRRKITWRCEEFFSPLLETQASILAGPRSTLCSAPASSLPAHPLFAVVCVEETRTNIAFFNLQKGKGSCVRPRYLQGGGEKHTLHPHHRGCWLIASLAAFPSARQGLVWDRAHRVLVSLNKHWHCHVRAVLKRYF